MAGRTLPFCDMDITYKLNTLGYRSEEFSTRGDINIACFGSSFAFGEAMPFDWVFHQILNERLSKELGCCVVTWNLSEAVLATNGSLAPW